jgi:uncharacterized membrane protein
METNDDAGREREPVEAPKLIQGRPLPDFAVTPIVHYYRAEVARGDVWRQRMDTTTNWAIVAATAIVATSFSRPDIPHVLLPLGGIVVFLLMCIEGRRYRFYDVYRSRTRLMESHLFVPYLLHEGRLLPGGWRPQLAEDLIQPSFKMSLWRATGLRLSRNYIWIFLILLVCWIARIATRAKPEEPTVFGEEIPDLVGLYWACGYGPIRPWMMLAVVSLFFASLGLWIWIVGRGEDPDAIIYTRRRSQAGWRL